MDMLTFLVNKQRGDKIPMFVIGQDHAMADPERPAYASDNAIARSLFEHYERTLRETPLVSNPLWHAMKAEASAIRIEQSMEPATYSSAKDIPDVGGDQTKLLLEASIKRDMLERRVDETVFEHQKPDAKVTLHRSAVEEAFSGKTPDAVHNSSIEGLGQLWDSPTGRDYRGALSAIAEASREWTKGNNVEAVRFNENLSAEERDPKILNEGEPLTDERKVYDAVLRSMPEPLRQPTGRWTDSYAIAATTNMESEVMTAFMNVALKAVDTHRDPTPAELGESLTNLRKEFEAPKTAMQWDQITEVIQMARESAGKEKGPEKWMTVAGEDDPKGRRAEINEEKAAIKAMKAGGADVSEIRLTRPKYVKTTVRSALLGEGNPRYPLIGLEGQRFYADEKSLEKVFADRKEKGNPTFISFTDPGSAFEKALIAAAGKSGVPVMHATMDVAFRTDTIHSNQTRTHVDGDYAADSFRFRQVMRTSKFDHSVQMRTWDPVKKERGSTHLPRDTDPLSFDGRKAANGALILMKVDAKQGPGRSAKQAEAMQFQAMINNAALLPNELIAFGNLNRRDKGLPRIINRRILSGYETPQMFDDKTKREIPRDQVVSYAKELGETLHEKNSAKVDLRAHEWDLKSIAGQLAVTRIIKSPEKAALLLDSPAFKTMGDIIQTGHEIRANPKAFAEIQQRLGIDKATGQAAVDFHRETRDTGKYIHATNVAETYATVSLRRQDGMLTHPKDPLVVMNGHVSGFSSPAARNAPQGSRIAIVGDEGPMSEQHMRQIDTVVSRLADQYGRDENGVAKMRINTTLSTGVGEAVMEAALRHKVPVEAIGYKDDMGFRRDTPDMRLLALAGELNSKGLGGAWTLHKTGNEDDRVKDSPSSRDHALRAAVGTSDAIVASRFEQKDVGVMILGAAGQTKPLFTLPPAGQDPEPWSGTRQLKAKDRNLTMVLDLHNGNGRAWHTDVMPGADFRTRPREGTVVTTVNTKSGAHELRSTAELATVAEAARGKVDYTMNRPDPTRDARRDLMAGKVRHEVMEQIDYDQFSKKEYVEGLKLKPAEMAAASELYGHMLVQQHLDELPTGRAYQSSLGAELKEMTSYSAGRSKSGSDRKNGGFEIVDRSRFTKGGGAEM